VTPQQEKNCPNCVFLAKCDIAQVRPSYLIFGRRLLCLLVSFFGALGISSIHLEGSKTHMNRPNWKCLLVVAVVAVVVFAAVPRADAQWWGASYRGWGCSYASCYSPCYTPCYASCYSCYTPRNYACGGCYAGWRRACRSYCGWGGCYSGGWGGCWSDGYATSSGCSSCGISNIYSDVAPSSPTPAPGQAPTPAKKPVVEPTMPMEPAAPAAPVPTEPAMPSTPLPPKTSDATSDESGVLTVWVPFDAKVTVNGLDTRSTGSRRQFISYGLKPGLDYKYVVRAQVVRQGQVQEDTRTVTLTAGQITAVAFGFNVGSQQVASAQ
jgi:uncharacterized protein (TIGR03000 family)